MAILFSGQTGNWTAAGTWRVVDATSYLNSEAASTASTTTFVSSSAFTPGAITVEGLAVKMLSRQTTPSGTFSVRLAQAGVAVAGTTVTVNVADLPNVSTLGFTWLYFKFAAPVVLLAATAYTLQIQSSVNNQVTLYRNATANNWSRCLVTSTTAAPAATDNMIVVGEYTGAGASATRTVTMDNTAATVFGTVANFAVEVGSKGTLAYGTAAATAYQLICGGRFSVGFDGTFTMGTSGTPMPSGSSALLQLNVASNLQFDFIGRGSVETYGNPITDRAIVTANAAVAATAITTDVSTGWVNGDDIVIAPTSAAPTAFDRRTVSSSAGTTVNITAGLTNAKTVYTGMECEVINLTRNVLIKGVSTTLQAQFRVGSGTLGDHQGYSINYTAFQHIQIFSTTQNTTNQPTRFNYTSHYDLGTGTNAFTIALAYDFLIESPVLHNVGVVSITPYARDLTAANLVFNNLWSIRTTSGVNPSFFIAGNPSSVTVTNSRFISGVTGFGIGNNASYFGQQIVVQDIICKCNQTSGFIANLAFDRQTNVFENVTAYLNATGVSFNAANGFIVKDILAFSNTGANINITNQDNTTIIRPVLYSGPVNPAPIGISLGGSSNQSIFIYDGDIGTLGNHSNGDIRVISTQLFGQQLNMYNTILSSSTEVALQTAMNLNSYISSARHDQTDGNHRIWKWTGTIQSDNTIFRSSPRSQRLTPLNASFKLESGHKDVAVKDGQTVTIGVWVRKSVVGDGQAYNGNQPRLILKANPANGAGITDTVLATASGAAGSWEYISGTTPVAIDDAAFKVVVDCDGTQGWVNVDDWYISSSNATKGEKYWTDGAPTEFVTKNQGGEINII